MHDGNRAKVGKANVIWHTPGYKLACADEVPSVRHKRRVYDIRCK